MKNRKPKPKIKTDDAPMPHKPGYSTSFAVSPIDNEYLIKGKKYPITKHTKFGFFIDTENETIFCLFDQCFHVYPYEWEIINS